MKVYLVGGAVRDELLGQPVGDRDWVVVGGSAQALVQAGFTPVGKDFPVFLHPQTHEQYALARTERKVAKGYAGFQFFADPSVRLEDDLARRDLTINAMARDPDGTLIDPFGGQADLRARCFRHVSPAFAEDPVRILRLARFAAQFPEFRTHPSTLDLMSAMVVSGEVDALVPERVWQEIARGLAQRRPSRMWQELQACGALERIAPELSALPPRMATQAFERIDAVAAQSAHCVAIRWALLVADVAEPSRANLAKRWRIPSEIAELAAMTDLPGDLADAPPWDAARCLALIKHADALRRPERFEVACAIWSEVHGVPAARLLQALAAARAVQAGPIVASLPDPRSAQSIAAAIDAARLRAVEAVLLPSEPSAPQK